MFNDPVTAKRENGGRRFRPAAGFTLVEALFGAAVVGIVFTALYAAMTMGFQTIALARENVQATQVLEEKFETLRLYNWTQVNSNGFIAPNFTVPMSLATNTGPYFTGTVSIASAPITEAYSNELKLVTITLQWMSGSRLNTRSMQGYVAHYGLQLYVY